MGLVQWLLRGIFGIQIYGSCRVFVSQQGTLHTMLCLKHCLERFLGVGVSGSSSDCMCKCVICVSSIVFAFVGVGK